MNPRLHRLAILTVAALPACAPAPAARTLTPALAGSGAAAAWEFQNPGSWAVEGGVLQLKVAGRPGGPIRKPAEWAILRSEPFADVVVDAQVRADAPVSRMGRDVLIYFGYQSPTRFYYAHLSNETTPPHNGIFLVNDADRLRIDDGTGVPRLLDDQWHDVRLERDVDSGAIRVYLDDMTTPVLQATDTTLRSGRIGFGSFDDPAAFRDVRVRARD
ncbi:MAG TPA: hypothetical protein VFZ18_14195 [Longimicrobiaceae bacterium]